MIDYHKAAQELLEKNEYRVYGTLTQAGCSFHYPPRLLEPRNNGFRRDYQLTPAGVAIQAWHGEELRDGFHIECPPYARKACVICDTIFCCTYLQYDVSLLKYIVNETEIEEGVFLKSIDGDEEETPDMIEKERALKALMGTAIKQGFSIENLRMAKGYGVLEGYDIACKVCQGDIA